MDVQSRFLDLASVGDGIDSVPEDTAWFPNMQRVAPSNPHTDLAYVRALFPFTQIMPLPDDVVTVVCVTPNQTYDLTLPSGTVLVHFGADGSDYYVNADGNALNPSIAANGNDPNSDNNRSQSMFRPDFNWWYIGNQHQFSVSSPTANRVVQVLCYIAKQRPL
jgi:hypothetical protein